MSNRTTVTFELYNNYRTLFYSTSLTKVLYIEQFLKANIFPLTL